MAVPAEIPRPRKSAAVMLRRFLAITLEGREEVITQDLINQAIRRFSHDPEFIEAAVEEIITELVPQMLHRYMKSRRDVLKTNSGAITFARLEQTAKEQLARVFENANGRYIAFMNMTRLDLIDAASSRERRVAGELRWAAMERDTAALMPNDTQTVGECLTDSQLAELLKKHFAPAA